MLRAPLRKKLWLGAAAMALFIGTIAVAYVVLPKPAHEAASVGLDFIAFYTAGTFVREGRAGDLYDIAAFQRFQHALAAGFGADLGSAVGPWWNPPFYAWVFVPLSKLPYTAALRAWVLINVACAAAAAALLARMLPKGCGWKSWALVPVLMALSVPFIHALSHAQNTCTSLLLLTVVVAAWRKEKALAAGLVAGLLFYKPQLAMLLAAVLAIDLGWRAVAGLAATGGMLLLVTLLTLPGTLGAYRHRLPANLRFVQERVPYLWERHVTFKAFWRLLLQGRGAGAATHLTTALTLASCAALGMALLAAAVRFRQRRKTDSLLWEVDGRSALAKAAEDPHPNPLSEYPSAGSGRAPSTPLRTGEERGNGSGQLSARRDRLIAAAVACTPLLMPFYFDYDQLLLAVPAVLFAAEVLRRGRAGAPLPRIDRWVLRIGPVYFAWLALNPDVAEHTRVNLTVPLLAAVASLLVTRAMPRCPQAIAQVEPAAAPAVAPAVAAAA